jgi:TonB family protein
MILQWLLHLLVLPVLLGVAVTISEPWLRSRAMPTRFLWVGAMVMSFIWAGLVVLLPRGVEAESGPIAYLPAVVVDATGAYARIAEPVQESVDELAPVLLAILIASAVLGLGRLSIAWFHVRAERADWRARRLDGCDVLISHHRGPAVVGMIDPKIVLPEWVASMDVEIRRVVLQHEREHTLARDVATLVAGRALQALVPWNPGIRWVSARLALAIEHDCDLRVLRSGIGRREYEQALLVVADRISAPRLAPSLSENASHLERRIIAMRKLNRRQSMFRPLAAGSFAVAALYAAFVLPNVRVASAQSLPSLRVWAEPVQPLDGASHGRISGAVSASADPVQDVRRPPRRSRSATGVPDTAIYSEHQVDRQVAIEKPMPALAYPAEQRAAAVNGKVLVQFVVDTLGRLEPGSLKVIRTDHDGFAAAARNFVEAATFKPATKRGRKVRQLVQMPFAFSSWRPPSN